MDIIIWLVIMIPCSVLITGIGIYAWKRKKPMWFWSGTTVSENEINDIPAYNKANGIMWICYSLIFWLCTILGFASMKTAVWFLMAGCFVGTPALIIAYKRIYKKYKTDSNRRINKMKFSNPVPDSPSSKYSSISSSASSVSFRTKE